MKTRLLQIVSLSMALVMLFVSVGLVVRFHYCATADKMTSGFVKAAATCSHCISHGHSDAFSQNRDGQLGGPQFDAKGCCEEFDSRIQFTDHYVISLDKHLTVLPECCILRHLDLEAPCPRVRTVSNNRSERKTLRFLSGRERTVFFSSLQLDPPVC